LQTNYVFIGGPKDMETIATAGNMYIDCMEQTKKISAASLANDPWQDSVLSVHSYALRKVNLFGTSRAFYISQKLTDEQVNQRIGLFMATLVDLYAAS
jgi:hypothetical protein